MNEEGVHEIAKQRVGLGNNEILVFGHTHKSWDGERIANTGCWYQGEDHKYVAIDDEGH